MEDIVLRPQGPGDFWGIGEVVTAAFGQSNEALLVENSGATGRLCLKPTPLTGQFLTVDLDVAQTQQAFVYADNDAVNGSDPSGLFRCSPSDPVTWLGCGGDLAEDVAAGAEDVAAGAIGGLLPVVASPIWRQCSYPN